MTVPTEEMYKNSDYIMTMNNFNYLTCSSMVAVLYSAGVNVMTISTLLLAGTIPAQSINPIMIANIQYTHACTCTRLH